MFEFWITAAVSLGGVLALLAAAYSNEGISFKEKEDIKLDNLG